MAIGVVMEFAGGTLEQYDRVMELMGLTGGDRTPEGLVFHWVAATGDGIRVTDVWEDRAQFDRFAEEQIGPYTQEAGVPGPPRVEFFEVHNTLARS